MMGSKDFTNDALLFLMSSPYYSIFLTNITCWVQIPGNSEWNLLLVLQLTYASENSFGRFGPPKEIHLPTHRFSNFRLLISWMVSYNTPTPCRSHNSRCLHAQARHVMGGIPTATTIIDSMSPSSLGMTKKRVGG